MQNSNPYSKLDQNHPKTRFWQFFDKNDFVEFYKGGGTSLEVLFNTQRGARGHPVLAYISMLIHSPEHSVHNRLFNQGLRPIHLPTATSVLRNTPIFFSSNLSIVSCIHICICNMKDRSMNCPGAAAELCNQFAIMAPPWSHRLLFIPRYHSCCSRPRLRQCFACRYHSCWGCI